MGTAADLPVQAWPAEDCVWLDFGRTAEANRLAPRGPGAGSEARPTASDYAGCTLSGISPVPYGFEERYAAPRLLMELSIGPADGLLTVQIDPTVPSLTGQVPNATFEALDVMYTTTASGLPGQP